jgi:hypothetical protein
MTLNRDDVPLSAIYRKYAMTIILNPRTNKFECYSIPISPATDSNDIENKPGVGADTSTSTECTYPPLTPIDESQTTKARGMESRLFTDCPQVI